MQRRPDAVGHQRLAGQALDAHALGPRERIEQVAAHLASQLAAPCEFLIFRKRLADAPGRGAR